MAREIIQKADPIVIDKLFQNKIEYITTLFKYTQDTLDNIQSILEDIKPILDKFSPEDVDMRLGQSKRLSDKCRKTNEEINLMITPKFPIHSPLEHTKKLLQETRKIIEKNDTQNTENTKIDKTSKKYKISLEYVNKILTISNLPEIEDLLEFKDIRKEYIIKKEVEDLLFESDLGRRLFKHFDKERMSYYIRKKINHYSITVLRKIVNDIGYDLTYYRKISNKGIDGEKQNKMAYFYSIVSLGSQSKMQ